MSYTRGFEREEIMSSSITSATFNCLRPAQLSLKFLNPNQPPVTSHL